MPTKKDIKKVLDLLTEMEKSERDHIKNITDSGMITYHAGKADGFVQAFLMLHNIYIKG